MKIIVPGIILIISCHKHINTRLKEFTLSKKDYAGWKVIIILGNPLLDSLYEANDNIITIKCEDSYIHIMKKLVFAMKILFELYEIQEGILRCGDDLVFDETKIEHFLQHVEKYDYMGKIAYINMHSQFTKKFDNFMPQYFFNHKEDLLNPLNGISVPFNYLLQLNEVPDIMYTGGVVTYLSTKSCAVLINEMERIKWDIFYYEEQYGYPYIIEDIGVGFALGKNNILPVKYELYSDNPYYEHTDDRSESFAFHTNRHK